MLLLAACSPDLEPAADPPAEGTARVLSYNVHGFPSALTGDDTPARMYAIGPLLDGYDLVGLQEVWDEEEAIAPLEETVTLEEVATWDEPLDDTKVYGTGLVSYARAGAVEAGGGWYSACYGTFENASDCFASKGWTWARVELAEGAAVDLWDTHMDAGNDQADDTARAVQVDELLAAIDDVSADHAVVLVGDFNMAIDDPEDVPLLEEIAAAGLADACDLVGCPEPARIDHVYVRDGGGIALAVDAWEVDAAFVDAEGVPLSDHDAIGVSVTWSRK
ncbi:MAG: endonuclease/exonuclease/phosphatase family protein [Myxococcota bacterium]